MFNFFKKRKKEPKDLKEILLQFDELKDNLEKLSKDLEKLKGKTKFSLQKFGVVRFNPFSEIGSNQSFSVALLNGENNGFIITSFYSREGNRVYAKPIVNGESEYLLSKEEKEALEKAMKKEK